MPIKNARFLSIDFVPVLNKSATTNQIAEIKNPQTRELIEKVDSNIWWKNKTVITVGIVAIIKLKLVLQKGCLIKSSKVLR